MQTAEDFEVLTEGLIGELDWPSSFLARRETELMHLVEQNLRKRIAELQEYRRMGITTAAEAEVYDQAKITRVSYQVLAFSLRSRV